MSSVITGAATTAALGAVSKLMGGMGGANTSPNTKTSVSIGGTTLNALSVNFAVHNQHGFDGMPQMGALACAIDVVIDMHDTTSLPFTAIRTLFDLVNGVDSSKIQDVKITYWTDESKSDAICVFAFRAWVASFVTVSSPLANHTLNLHLQPELDQGKFIKIDVRN